MVVKALTGDAWDGKANGWPSDYDGNAAHAPWLQTSLLLAETGPLLKDAELAKKATELGKAVIARHPERPLALALRLGGLAGALRSEKATADRRIKAQGPDGSWAYAPTATAEGGLSGLNAPPEPGVIAPEGFKSQGITAGELAPIFEYVKITGDEAAFRACLKGLDHLDTYAIPFPYRQPECPPSPSLHGSYLALRCYLIAYEITGDRRYLEKAVYWAKTGLPFIYLWSLPAREVTSGYIHCAKKLYIEGGKLYQDTTRDPMLYGGLYGYGSTQFSHHWYGIIVHWIPLVYARDLVELARYDHTLPWERVADGILTSGLWQAYDQPPYAGFLPDAFSLDSWTPSGPAFSPGTILENLLKIQYAREWGPQSVIVRDGERRCHVTSAARVEQAKLASGNLSFSLNDPAWPQARAIVAGLGTPAAVLADGQPLPKVDELESKEEAWSSGPLSLLLVKVKSGDHARHIELR